ncbi:MAG: Ku protein, partial [Candidatus Saccharimonadales bacterium]
GEKPYRVLSQAMADEECCAVGQIVFSGREEIALIRPVDKVLTMSLLNYASQLKPLSDFSSEVAGDRARADELKLARTLIQQTTSAEADIEQYRDTYTEQFKAAIEAKVEGREVVMPAAEEEAPIVNLMDALRNSLKGKGRAASERSPRHAPAAARRRRKSS